jgi:putative transposase
VAAFIAAQGEQHGIPYATACRALQVSPAWFYKWRHGDPSPRHARRIGLAAEVARLFAKHHGKYGSPRITADLRAAGRRVSENTVATLMREQQLVARAPRRRKQTTRQGRGRWRAPDLIGRDFAADQVNRKWYGDGTEIPADEGKLFHTDQGSEYTAGAFRTACTRVGVTQSMGRVGSALDNAVIESWHSTLEFELRRLEHFATRAQGRRAVAAWIEDYNRDRRHSALGMASPIDHERALRTRAEAGPEQAA